MASSTNKPLVSIVTAFHNRGAEIEKSVGSLLAQTYTPLEIIVIDDGSTDDTAEQLKRFNDDRLIVVSQANQGFTRSIDAGVRRSRGDFVAIHGAGDISLPERVARQAQVLAEFEDVAVVGCHIVNEGAAANANRKDGISGRPVTYLEILRNYPMTHGEAMFRRTTFDKAGGYRAFFEYAQDHDLWHRMDHHGKFWIVPEQLYVRKRFDNAVNADPIKLMLQAYYGNFAEECIREREATGRDLLDRYRSAAPFFAAPSLKLSKKLSGLGANALLNGNEQAGRTIIAASRAQAKTSRTLLLSILADLSLKHTALWSKYILPLVKQVLQRSNKA